MTSIVCPTKYDWYQTDTYVFITIRRKSLTTDDCSVTYDGSNLKVLSNDLQTIIFSAPLSHPINKDNITLTFSPAKIEVRVKKISGERWSTLSKEEEKLPSVSKKNWDAVEKEAEKEDSDNIQSLFQQIYENADDDTRKAMIKSYTESCGTVLSTNWGEIGSKKTEVKPPDGLEYRKE